jgi:hypothetical protein
MKNLLIITVLLVLICLTSCNEKSGNAPIRVGETTEQPNLKDSINQEQKDTIFDEIRKEKEPINQN